MPGLHAYGTLFEMTDGRVGRGFVGLALLSACGGRAIGGTDDAAGGVSAAGQPTLVGGMSSVGGASAGAPTIGGGGRSVSPPAQGGASTSQGGTGALQGGAATGGGPSAAGATGGAACTDVEPCGGKLEGAWSVTSSCLEVTGVADIARVGLGCKEVPLQGTLFVTGSFSVDALGTVEDRTLTVGNVRFSLPQQCLDVSGTVAECPRVAAVFYSMGYERAECSLIGGVCECQTSVNQAGTMGLVTPAASTAGQAKSDQRTLYVSTLEGTEAYYYCGSGKTLQVTPRGGGLRGTVSGTILLERR